MAVCRNPAAGGTGIAVSTPRVTGEAAGHMTSVNHLARLAKRQRGFSLIELMLTLVIAATLMGVAVPAFRGMVNSNRVLTQSNDIVAALNIARSEAISRIATITFCGAATASST